MPQDRRPPRFPPPQFPPHRLKPFARTPPAIFPPILGLMGSVLALRGGFAALDWPMAPVDLLTGAVLALWAFSVLAIKVKALRRPGVLVEDMRPIPGRAGLAAASMSGMAAGALLTPLAPTLALVVLFAALFAHLVMLAVLGLGLSRLPADQREVNPTLHLALVGFIVAAPPLAQMGWAATATTIFWVTLALALPIWGISLLQLARRIPPAPLRPLLAIHLAPAALLSTTAAKLGLAGLSTALAALGLLIALALLAGLRWVTATGFSPMWGAFTFPLAALATALLAQGGLAGQLGLAVAAVALPVNGWIAWRVLKLWPGNRLAQMTNAAEA